MKVISLSVVVFTLVAALFPSSALAQSWSLPRDAQGWSVIEPSSDSRLIYVSDSGNDSTGQHYSLSQVGPDPRNPSISVNAYKTISAAMAQMQNGKADWVMLKAGDTFTLSQLSLNGIGSGRDSDERLVLTYYGTSSQRPVVRFTGGGLSSTNTSLNVTNNGLHNWAFIGIEWYHAVSDPNSSSYNPSIDRTGSASFVCGGSNILFEDCVFRFYELVVDGVDRRWNNIEIRRNILVDQYFKDSCTSQDERPSGAYISKITNYLIEENTSDHAGWNEDVSGAGRNQFNHGFYITKTNDGDLYFRGNIISRASGNAAQSRAGGLVEYNVSIQSPAGLFTARDTSAGFGATQGLTAVYRNLVLEGLWMGNCTQSSGANWGMPLDANLESNTLIQENIIAHNLNGLGSVDGIENHSHLSYVDNIVYNFGSSDDMFDPSWPDPDRSVGSYNATIGGAATTVAYINSIRNRALHSWPYQLSAYALIDYIREGFGLDPVGAGSGVNLAEGKSVTASSYQDDSTGYQPPSFLIDGDTDAASRWSALGMPQWAVVDLGASYAISEIRVYPYQGRDYQYTVEISSNGSSYSTIVNRSNNTQGGTVLIDSVSATGRYVRLSVTGGDDYTGDWVSITELEVIAASNSTPAGYITRDYWTGVGGITVASLTGNANYPNNPAGSDSLTSFEGIYWSNPSVDRDWGTDYGQRIYGFIHAPATGNYTFWISGDDQCALYLSTDDLPSNASLIAQVPGYTGWRVWNKYPAQKSGSVYLTAGQVYYIEAVHKEGNGGDHVAVAWAKPGESTSAPSEVIPGSVLSPW